MDKTIIHILNKIIYILKYNFDEEKKIYSLHGLCSVQNVL